MLSSALDFPLPPELIAQTPHEPRDESRLLHFHRGMPLENAITHRRVCDLPKILQAGDMLVFNDTRVLRARLYGHRNTGGKVEALLLQEHQRNLWQALLKPSARLRVGERVFFESEDSQNIPALLEERMDDGWLLRFEVDQAKNVRELLPQFGQVPVPPYIKTVPQEEQYQTVYSQEWKNGESHESPEVSRQLDSCAAPTAGLHFTDALLQSLEAMGIETQFLTLGVGVGTFRPVQTETLEEHEMHEERFFVTPETAQAINRQKQSGKRVIAVGTTTLRVLESICDDSGQITAGAGRTDIFIRPGFRFRCVDALMTNFHLPRSTLLALVAAIMENEESLALGLSGLASVRYAYTQAVALNYRFFSFGDAMFIE
jgi:S-adenosylmethionine:tRNA ribosyltransferase-isomerase